MDLAWLSGYYREPDSSNHTGWDEVVIHLQALGPAFRELSLVPGCPVSDSSIEKEPQAGSQRLYKVCRGLFLPPTEVLSDLNRHSTRSHSLK